MPELLSIIGDAKNVRSDARASLGIRGEALAAEFLKDQGYRLVLANFKVPIGRNSRGVQVTGEIDLVALDDDTLCFVEVKTRRSDEFTPVITNVDLRKQRQIIRTAKIYRRTFGVWERPYRYDVVTVLMPKHSDHVIELVKGFWNEGKFRKKNWVSPGWSDFG
jgi:putative endonuclease